MTDIDPIEYGKLVNSVENLERKVDAMDNDIKKLVAMAERSKGSLWALMGVASVAGAFISYVSDMLFRKQEIVMPMVKDKKFPYTAKGKKEAKQYAMKTSSPVKAKPAKKMTAKRGY